jgi:hypothetical protein
MATPNYLGRGQPAADSGGWLGTWLGTTPTYQGVGQPSSKSSAIGGAAPAYKPAPSSTAAPGAMTSPSAEPNACGHGPIAIVIPREVIEQH